jgi:hypothetical protein
MSAIEYGGCERRPELGRVATISEEIRQRMLAVEKEAFSE